MWAIRAIALDCTSATSGVRGSRVPGRRSATVVRRSSAANEAVCLPSSVRMRAAAASPSKGCVGESMPGWVAGSVAQSWRDLALTDCVKVADNCDVSYIRDYPVLGGFPVTAVRNRTRAGRF